MTKKFNVTGTCIPEENYMVDITDKLEQIKVMIDAKEYFTINRGRQYGKTTTLFALEGFLSNEYTVISISFEGMGDESFTSEEKFCQTFLDKISEALRFSDASEDYRESWKNSEVNDFVALGKHITNMCVNKKLVLMIDEVDKASNHRIFLNFLSKLREKYLARRARKDFTFHSVILAGVYDIKNIKLKMIQEGLHTPTPTETKTYNSPWNIAVSFEVDMSFNTEEIMGMLTTYEQDHQTNMDKAKVAEEIHFYTQGYPVLVSKICQYLDVKLKEWSEDGVREAVRLLVRETDNELFKSLSQNLETNENVYQLMYDVLILGRRRSFSTDDPAVDLAYRYCYIRDDNERIKVSNKIFEIRMTNYFIVKDEGRVDVACSGSWIPEITRGGRFNMQLCLERFVVHWQEIYNEKRTKFFEKECRILFLMYLRPLLNGFGFAHIESETTDDRRMDLVVTYGKERFVLELKIWRGQLYNDKGMKQLLGYMDKLNEDKGYLVTFDFRKKPEKLEPQWTSHDEKKVFEVRV